MQKTPKIIETLSNGYSSESTQRELSNEYQDDRVSMVFQESCILVLWTKVVSALEGLIEDIIVYLSILDAQNLYDTQLWAATFKILAMTMTAALMVMSRYSQASPHLLAFS